MISVCMPTYNGEKYIKEQLDSILSQISDTDEVIVSDDSSSDKTVEIIKSYNDSRIRLLENNHFRSPIYNLENALKQAKGDYIFLADQDDVWFPNKVERLLSCLSEYDCVVSDAKVVNSNLEVLNESFMKINHSHKGLVRNIIKNGFLGCCMAFRKEILEHALPFPNPIPMHDTWLGLVSEKYGKTLFLKEPLIYYRRHGNNASPTAEKSCYSLREKIQHRILFFRNIVLR